MKYLKLNNGVEMPLEGYGTYRVTKSIDGATVLKDAIDIGYRLIDTAQAYGNEEAVGDGIKLSGVKREDIFLTTKVWFHTYENGECAKSVHDSLKRLKTDYLDMVLLHWPYGNVHEAWRDLEKLYKAGDIRAIGVSNFPPDRLIDLINFNEVVPAVNQIEVHLYCQRKWEREWFDKYGVACQAYAPLGKGKLNEMFDLPQLKEIGKAHNKTTAQVMLRFLTQCNVSVIPKSAHKERIAENFDIFDFTLSDEEMTILKDLDKNMPVEGIPADPEKVIKMYDFTPFQG